MKIYSLTPGQLSALRVSFSLVLAGITCSAQAVDVVFTATFQAPTCQVSAPASLDFGTVLSSDIKQGVSLANPLPLDITLSQCAGFIGTVQKPGIKITGVGNSDTGEFLFRQPAGSQSVNYGVRITTADVGIIANNTFVPAPFTSANFDGGSAVIPLSVALSCGNKCNDAATKAGSLTASVTFDFAYQ